MGELKIIDIYNDTSKAKIRDFNKNIDSSYIINTVYEKKEADFEWLEIMENTIKYLDNILRNPNRFIINEEEIVNIEKARRTTVESIKYLAKHTNLIQKIEDNGDIKPSKILNVNNDESFNTYENRFIYTLIQNMSLFIELKKRNLILESSLKDNKDATYKASTKVGIEKVEIEVNLHSRLLSKDTNNVNDILARIDKLELQVENLTNSEVYKTLAKLHVGKIIPPIKKTNLILKNTNFQMAMKLWDYLQEHNALENKVVKKSINYKDDLDTKDLFDSVFLLNYLTVSSVDNMSIYIKEKEKKERVSRLTNELMDKIIELNPDMKQEELQSLLGNKIAIFKNKKEASIHEIQDKMVSKMQSYIDRIESFRF